MKLNKENITLMEFCVVYKIPSNFHVDDIPLQHPETGEKVYFIGSHMMESWYRKKPGQAGKSGQMWPFCQGLSFDVRKLHVHFAIKKELGGSAGTFQKNSPISRKKIKIECVYKAHHDDSPCEELLEPLGRHGGNYCPECKIHPDTQSICLKAYCPHCQIILSKDLICRECEVQFVRPS